MQKSVCLFSYPGELRSEFSARPPLKIGRILRPDQAHSRLQCFNCGLSVSRSFNPMKGAPSVTRWMRAEYWLQAVTEKLRSTGRGIKAFLPGVNKFTMYGSGFQVHESR